VLTLAETNLAANVGEGQRSLPGAVANCGPLPVGTVEERLPRTVKLRTPPTNEDSTAPFTHRRSGTEELARGLSDRPRTERFVRA
jgi:hypothetical protein